MLEDIIRTVKNLEKIDRDNYGDLSMFIGSNALNEAYENDKELHSLLHRYRNDETALKVINETLICICGWGLETIYNNTYGKEK